MTTPSLSRTVRICLASLALFVMTRLVSAQEFIRGDANLDGRVDISDATSTLGCLFLGSACPDDCRKVADANDDGAVDIADPILTLGYLFLGAKAPPAPFPACGVDATPDGLACRSYPHCGPGPATEEEGEGDGPVQPGKEEGSGEGLTLAPRVVKEVEQEDGLLILRLSAQLPRGADEAIMRLTSVVWEDAAGGLHVVDSLPPLGIGATAAEGLPAADLPAGSYVGLRLRFGSIELVTGEESVPLDPPAELDVAFNGARVVEVEAGRRTVALVDLSLIGEPIKAALVEAGIAPTLAISPLQLVALEQLRRASRTPPRMTFDGDGRAPRFAAGEWPVDPTERTPALQAIAFLRAHAPVLSLEIDHDGFLIQSVRESKTLGTMVRLQQTWEGIPVFGADVVVRVQDGHIRHFNGRFLSARDLTRDQVLTGSQAFLVAQADLAGRFRGIQSELAGEPELVVYRPSLRHGSLEDADHLAFHVILQTLAPAGRWSVMVDAQDRQGRVLDSWDAAFQLNNSRVIDAESTSSTSDDTEWYEDNVNQQGGTPPGEVGPLENHQKAYFLYMQNRLGINSIDDSGKEMVCRANDPAAATLNACWDCRNDETIYLTGWVTADVVAHEFTHGIVEKLAGGLGSSVQARTLNESTADVFAELADCAGGGCNWLVGTDYLGNQVPGDGVVRDLANPTVDHMSDYDWATTSPYKNSGIPSMVAYLLVAGDTHRGVTVGSIGLAKTEQLYISTLADSGLSSSATFEEYREVMLETASSLPGFTTWDRQQVFRAWASVGLGAITQPSVGALNESSDYFGWTLASGNFNGDAYEDLAIGSPYESYDGKEDTGVVFVFYGSSFGLDTVGAETIAQSHLGGSSASNGTGDRFGTALAVGNFNGDGFDDLAIGAPYENTSGHVDAGMVKVVYGTAQGLKQNDSTWWEAFSQESANGAVETDDRFGWSLAAGDFNGDDHDDLAVGTPYESLGSTTAAGLVNVFYGSGEGLIQPDGTMSWEGFTQALVEANDEAWDAFGWSLAAGNFDADGYDDLAVGVPYEDIGSSTNAGVVNLVYGSSQGLIRNGPSMKWERLSQSTFDTDNEDEDLFGWSLAVGKFSNGAHRDLAIGSPGEDFDGRSDAGLVTIVYGADAGLYPPAGWHRLAQSHAGGANESGDQFGEVLAVGNLNGDAWDELVVGVPHENALGKSNNGVVTIFYGSSNGLYPSGYEWYGQSLTGGAEDDSDRYGWAVACGDFDNDGEDDLAASAPWEDGPGGVANVGAVYVREY